MKSILLASCPDSRGIIHAITDAILRIEGNILDLEQHVDAQAGQFFMRVEWDGGELAAFHKRFKPVADRFHMWSAYYPARETQRLALFASKEEHCLVDAILRVESAQLPAEVAVVISNHDTLRSIVARYGVRYELFEITDENKREQEENILSLLDKLNVDVIGLARYMRILGEDFGNAYPNRIINVHHSFLPAFQGARPYHQAYERGVKIIGATSHYVTEKLDEGPIIEQAVQRVGHKYEVEDLVEIGKEIERQVFYFALKKHLERKIIVFDNRTIIFH
jgi:formyltetrahydrofolate deformylase